MSKIELLFVLILSMILGMSCEEQQHEGDSDIEKAHDEVCLFSDTVFYVSSLNDSVEVIIDYPESLVKGTVILLQGWNFPNSNWCDSTQLCAELSKQGFVVVQPDMKKSIYAWKRYKQTRKDWYNMPTRQWFVDTLIPRLQSIHILDPKQTNAIIGLSTGARGALLIGLDSKGLFSHIVVLSGDYDQQKFPNDNLYKGYFGTIAKHPECYVGKENPIEQLDKFKGKLFIAHGGQDKVVAVQHSRRLVDKLKEVGTFYEYVEVNDAKHDYAFWGSQTKKVLSFIQKN